MAGEKPVQSMGCHVEQPVCPICGETPDQCQHIRVMVNGETVGVLSEFRPEEYRAKEPRRVYELALRGFTVDHVSIVQAPRCMHCGERMKGCSPTQWSCVNECCEEHLRPVRVHGVHPIMVREGENG